MTPIILTFSRGLSLLASLVFAIAMMPSLAAAIPSYTLDLAPGPFLSSSNETQFTLTNTSTGGEEITAFSISVGDDENYFYDFVAGLRKNHITSLTNFATELATGAILTGGDRVNDQSGSATIEFVFSGFQSGEGLIFDAEIEPTQPGGSLSTDSRFAFLNNGDADNAIITVLFSDGSIAEHVFEDIDGALPDEIHIAGIGEIPGELTDNPFPEDSPVASAPVPEPGAALLFGFGLLTVASKPRRTEKD